MRVSNDRATFAPRALSLVELPSGAGSVKVRAPGVLFEVAVFDRLPDLVAATEGEPAPRDVNLIRKQGIQMVCHCAVEPRFSGSTDPPEGTLSIDDLPPDDFWFLVAHLVKLLTVTRAEEAETINPLSVARES